MLRKFQAYQDFESAFYPTKIVFMNSIREENKYLPEAADICLAYDKANDSSFDIIKKINDFTFEKLMSETPENFCIDLRNLKMDDEKKLASIIRTLVMHSKKTQKFAKAYIINGDARIQELMRQIVNDPKIEIFQYH